jgi:hypothetical protein
VSEIFYDLKYLEEQEYKICLVLLDKIEPKVNVNRAQSPEGPRLEYRVTSFN